MAGGRLEVASVAEFAVALRTRDVSFVVFDSVSVVLAFAVASLPVLSLDSHSVGEVAVVVVAEGSRATVALS